MLKAGLNMGEVFESPTVGLPVKSAGNEGRIPPQMTIFGLNPNKIEANGIASTRQIG